MRANKAGSFGMGQSLGIGASTFFGIWFTCYCRCHDRFLSVQLHACGLLHIKDQNIFVIGDGFRSWTLLLHANRNCPLLWHHICVGQPAFWIGTEFGFHFHFARLQLQICTLTRVLLGLSMAIVYAAILVKTNRLARVFKPNSALRPRWIGPSAQVELKEIWGKSHASHRCFSAPF